MSLPSRLPWEGLLAEDLVQSQPLIETTWGRLGNNNKILLVSKCLNLPKFDVHIIIMHNHAHNTLVFFKAGNFSLVQEVQPKRIPCLYPMMGLLMVRQALLLKEQALEEEVEEEEEEGVEVWGVAEVGDKDLVQV